MVKKMIHRKAYKQEEYLPVKLIDKLNDIFISKKYQYTSRNNFIQCISIIFYHQVANGIGLYDYAPLGRNYWHKVYGGNYHESVITPLLEQQVIETLNFGHPNFPTVNNTALKGMQQGSVVTRYRINPDLLCDQYDIIEYAGNGKVMTGFDWIMSDKQEFIEPIIPDLNFHVTIDKAKACKWVDDNAENICHDFLRNESALSLPERMLIGYRLYDGQGSYDVEYRSVAYAKMIAEKKGLEFFYFNDTFYIANIEEFLKQRIPALAYYYKHQICQIGRIPIEEKQSKVTLRIYSHLTNFPSKILQFININGRTVVQLDLRTSQFLIFANLLNTYITHGKVHLLSLFKQKRNITYLNRLVKVLEQHKKQLPAVGVNINDNKSDPYSSSDVTKFIRDVFFTDFYETVKNELGFQKRMLAKTVLFKLLFKTTNRKDDLLERLTERYPIVMSIIAEFKKPDTNEKNKNKVDDDRQSNFSVFLQCVEAEIFVDNILDQLRKTGIPCFTRHDSIVVAYGYHDEAEEIARNTFNQFGFKYNHKVEDKLFDVVTLEELEDSGYMDWLCDEDILNANYEVEGAFSEPIHESDDYGEDLDDEQMELLDQLKVIGIQDDYYEFVNVAFLEDICALSILSQAQRDWLEEDVMNLRYGMCFFQPNTNKVLRYLAGFLTE
jgi:hypothetical protein